MKNIKIFLFISLLAFSAVSCTDYLDVNTNPNNPTAVTPKQLLPAIEGRLSYTMGGDFSRYSGILDQHIDGATRQFEVIHNYTFVPADTETLWANLYSGTLADIFEIKDYADANSNPHYRGVALVLESYMLLLTTDYFGNIPYSEFKTGNLQPAYDSQADIYTAIFNNLTEAYSLLGSADESGFVPASDDLIYRGNTDKWIKFAKAIEARAHLRGKSWSQALSAIQNSYSSSADEASYQYNDPATENAPWYQYIDQRDDIEVGDSYVALLEGLGDPRVSTLGATIDLPHPVFVKDQLLPYLSYEEAKFIEAEALFRTQGASAAENAYFDGIKASFDRLGHSQAEYNDYISQATVSNVSLNTIMTQKYIALYTDQESFTDWRRTGIPSLSPNSGQQIPRRYPYPQSELNFNPNVPSGVTIFDRVGWDN